MKKWYHTKLGHWIWSNFWYRIDWWREERRFYRWVKYGRDHFKFVRFETWDDLHKWEDDMIKFYGFKPRKSILNIFKPYHKWPHRNKDI